MWREEIIPEEILMKTETGERFRDENSLLNESDMQGTVRNCGRNEKPETENCKVYNSYFD